MQITLQTANVISDAKNCFYPNKVVATNASEMKEAIKKDHVCATFTDNRRSNGNFLKSSVLVMDCDNDHSENPADWITPDKLEELFPDICYAVAFSRNHMKEKNGKTARPRFHVYFEIEECNDPAKYAGLKQTIWSQYPFFDDNALDAARFIFGADTGDIIWHEGWLFIDDMVLLQPETTSIGKLESPARESDYSDYAIPIGSRNSSMSLFAARVLKRFGDSEKSHGEFLRQAARCNPPLEDAELDSIWKSALSFYKKKVVTSEDYVSPEKYDEELFRASLDPEDYSDIGEARVLAREYQDELKYSDATRFLRYDGTRWLENEQYAMAAILEFLDLQLADAQEKIEISQQALIKAKVPEDIVRKGSGAVLKHLGDEGNPLLKALRHAEYYKQFAMSRRDYHRITATANTAKPMMLVDVCDLDKNEYLLNTPDATYDIQKGMSGKQLHNPADLITKITACTPGEEGQKIWLDTLDLIFCGNQELTDYVQQVVGLAAIGRVLHEHMIIAYGDGANGKSTFWNTIARVMGDYSGKLSAEALTTKCVRNVKPEMAELKGRRLIISSELEEGMRLNTSVVKQLCSTDTIIGEKKYKAPFFFIPSHTLVLYTNHLPKVGANDDGIWRRLIVVPFNAKITGSRDIKNYSDYLFEHAGKYIMQWIIEGAHKVITNDYRLEQPAIVKEAIEAYRAENDWMAHFLYECCEVDPSLNERSGQLYDAYRAYCMRTNEYSRSTTDFYTALEHAGFEKRKTKTGAYIYGLKLREGQDFLS